MKHLFLASEFRDAAADITAQVAKVTNGKNMLFIPTAAEVLPDDKTWVAKEKQGLEDLGFAVTEFSLISQNPEVVQSKVDAADVIFVLGGNTVFLLEQMRKSGFDLIVKKVVEHGKPYIGSSAGSMVAGPAVDLEELDDPAQTPKLESYQGLGLIDVAIFPHWGSQEFRDGYMRSIPKFYGRPEKMILLSNGQYLHVTGDVYQIVSVSSAPFQPPNLE